MMDNTKDYTQIKGWGIDADPDNDPTYPMRHRNPEDPQGTADARPDQQPVNMEVLHSVDRRGVSAVFGNAEEPAGLSGVIRREAFKFSEARMAHWLPLVLADRINVVEGYIEDLSHGHIPNVFAERGWGAEWAHDPRRVVKKVALGVGVASALVAWAVLRKPVRRR